MKVLFLIANIFFSTVFADSYIVADKSIILPFPKKWKSATKNNHSLLFFNPEKKVPRLTVTVYPTTFVLPSQKKDLDLFEKKWIEKKLEWYKKQGINFYKESLFNVYQKDGALDIVDQFKVAATDSQKKETTFAQRTLFINCQGGLNLSIKALIPLESIDPEEKMILTNFLDAKPKDLCKQITK